MATVKDSLVGCLKLKLGSCLTGPTKRLVADLFEAARSCDAVRNGLVQRWLRWRWEHPDWTPAQRSVRGVPKVTPAGAPVLESALLSQHCEKDLYDHGKTLAPQLSTQLVSCLRKEVLASLGSALPYERAYREGPHADGDWRRQRWQAVLDCREQPPCFRSGRIPVPCSSAALAYRGRCYAGPGVPAKRSQARGTAEEVARRGHHHCVLRFALFNATSGRQFASPLVTLEARQLPRGQRQVLARIAAGAWKLCDGWLTFDRGFWWFLLSYRQPSEEPQLNPERTATLWPTWPGADRPFLVETPGGQPPSWGCGNGQDLAHEYCRLEARRRMLRERYRTATSGTKGHGKGRFFAKLKPWARVTQQAQDRFCWLLIKEVIKFCKRNDCGKVVYREPDLAARAKVWLAGAGVPFDWTGLRNKMEFKLRSLSIALEVQPCPILGLRNRFGPERGATGACTPQGKAPQPFAAGNGKGSRFGGARPVPSAEMLDSERVSLDPTTGEEGSGARE